MSCFIKLIKDSSISIPRICEFDGVTYYEILMKIGQINWTVRHRYSDFRDLHEKLMEKRSVSKDLLPPKKVLGNKSPAFLEKRRNGLEKYLNDVFIYLQLAMPREFVEFLDMHKYDVIFLLQGLANKFYLAGASPILSNENYNFSALELFSISERLKIPCPPPEYCDKEYDFSHILDYCSKLPILTISPYADAANDPMDETLYSIHRRQAIGNSVLTSSTSSSSLPTYVPIGTSNIIPQELQFELSAFKSLKKLVVKEVSTENIYHAGTIRDTLEYLNVHRTNIDELNKIFLCDDLHKNQLNIENGEKIWTKIVEINLSSNLIKKIDISINLLPNVKKINLNRNLIEKISNLNKLSNLSILSLNENKISECIDWHLELGNLIELNLSQNLIKSLKGFRKLYSLVNLDVSCNLIDIIDEVDHISILPLLENLRLTGNPIAGSVDYRPRVLSRFGSRANEIYLDNEKGSQSELDTALVLSALRMSQTNSIISNEQINSIYSSINR